MLNKEVLQTASTEEKTNKCARILTTRRIRGSAAQKQGHLLAAKVMVEPYMWVMAQDRLKDDVIWIGQGFKVESG